MMLESIKSTEGLVFEELPKGEDRFYGARIDYKFLLPKEALPRFLDFLKQDFICHGHGGETTFKYHNIYFDTRDLLFFHQHRQGRDRRLKIRIREYKNGAINRYIECKSKERGITSKEREAVGFDASDLDILKRDMLRRHLEATQLVPEDLTRTLELYYDRLSLTAKDGSIRVTLDDDLHAVDKGGNSIPLTPSHLILELKTEREPRAIVRFLKKTLRVREVNFSKYCVALCRLHPELKKNRWKPIFRKFQTASALQPNVPQAVIQPPLVRPWKKLMTPLFALVFLGLVMSGSWGHAKPATTTTDTLLYFTSNTSSSEYNRFEEENGLFRFEYRNHLEPKLNQRIYFLQDIRNKKTSFQIFEAREDMHFDAALYDCMTYVGSEERYKNKTLCFSNNSPNLVANLELFGGKDIYLQKYLSDLQAKGVWNETTDTNAYDFFSRGEGLKLALDLRYPKHDFRRYAADCFLDVERSHPLSGYVCYAQKTGLITGIEGNFYPDNNINVFGLLKFLSLAFEKSLTAENLPFDTALFGNMTQHHYAYPLLSRSVYEGLLSNLTDESLWSNQVVYQGEAIRLTHRFLEWIHGKTIKNYRSKQPSMTAGDLFIQPKQLMYHFKPTQELNDEHRQIVNTALVNGKDVYVMNQGNVYVKVLTFKTSKKVQQLLGYISPAQRQISLEAIYSGGQKTFYETTHPADEFRFLNQVSETGMQPVLKKLEAMQLLPHAAYEPKGNALPALQVRMAPEDFENLLIYRTGERKYPAYLVMQYPDGRKVEQSIFIKTRGNASKGYIKSSYNIDFSSSLTENPEFLGDEFLSDHDVLKLRSFINEETMIHEKLFYDTFKKLGHHAPEYFEATLKINDVPLGIYQATEPIDDAFFARRKISTLNYYYAQNVGSSYNTNLKNYVDDATTLSQYEMTGDPQKLLEFIHRLEADDPTLIWSLDHENIFDYALLVFLVNARDSLTHNFYLYLDEATQKWNIMLWDGDMSFKDMPVYSKVAFLAFTAKHEYTFNNLIYYFFQHLDPWELDYYLKNFQKKWRAKVDLTKLIEFYKEACGDYFRYDNALWNGKKLELERANPYFDTMKALDHLRQDVKKMSDGFLQG